jgi:signal transduction histidine kinase
MPSSQPAAAVGELTRDDLLDLLLRYNEATERLRASHDGLKAEVARLTAELEQKNRELERRERLAMLGEMAAGVAHEIRNPLGGISLYADALVEDLAGQCEPCDLAVRIQGGVRVLNRIVEDMLLFARELRLDVQVHALGDLVRGAVELASPEIARGGLRVALDDASLDVAVAVDGSLVTRALLNMALNSAQAGQGRGDASLRIAAERPADRRRGLVALTLEDTCGGIDPEDLPRIFNPFFTRRDAGTGLGLAIVHRTVEAHGGTITASNNARGGATLRLTLPLSRGVGVPPVAGDDALGRDGPGTHGQDPRATGTRETPARNPAPQGG